MFPQLKAKKSEENLIIKEEFCADHCQELINLKEKEICSKYTPITTPEKKEEKKKVLFTADGVYLYYKNFVHQLLRIIEYEVRINLKMICFKNHTNYQNNLLN